MQYTVNYNLSKPQQSDPLLPEALSENFDTIDEKLKEAEAHTENPDAHDNLKLNPKNLIESVPVSKGGTGKLSFTAQALLAGAEGDAIQEVPLPVTTNAVLYQASKSSMPMWKAASAMLDLIGAAASSHTHTPSSIGAATAGHTHTPSSIGAATSGHTHTPASIGAAAASHAHTPSSIGALSILTGSYTGTGTVYWPVIQADAKIVFSFCNDEDTELGIFIVPLCANLHFMGTHVPALMPFTVTSSKQFMFTSAQQAQNVSGKYYNYLVIR